MFAKKFIFSLLCATLWGMVACDDTKFISADVIPADTPPSVDSLDKSTPPPPSSIGGTPSLQSGEYAPLATTVNIRLSTELYDSWKASHFTTPEEDASRYPSLSGDFSEVYRADFLPAGRVLWAAQNGGEHKISCSVKDATEKLMKNRACTISEGIGYGMLLSYFNNDDDAFFRLWNYNRAVREYNGSINLMPRIVESFTHNIVDRASVTEADLDIATALILMYYKSRLEPYKTDALAIINDIWTYEIEPNSKLILSSNSPTWNGKRGTEIVYNLGYFSPVALRLFAQIDPSHNWNGVLDAMYTYMAKVQDSGTGVFPDWSNAAGVAVEAPNGSSTNTYYQFNKEGVRIPWRIAWDYYWYQDSRAATVLNKLNNFIVEKSSGNVKSTALGTIYSWNLSIGADETMNTTMVAGMWLGAWCSTGIAGNTSWLNNCTTELNTKELTNSTSSYFNDILLVMYSTLLNGMFVKPF
jgi:hypothetical protein